jgi:hypothetical protein
MFENSRGILSLALFGSGIHLGGMMEGTFPRKRKRGGFFPERRD